MGIWWGQDRRMTQICECILIFEMLKSFLCKCQQRHESRWAAFLWGNASAICTPKGQPAEVLNFYPRASSSAGRFIFGTSVQGPRWLYFHFLLECFSCGITTFPILILLLPPLLSFLLIIIKKVLRSWQAVHTNSCHCDTYTNDSITQEPELCWTTRHTYFFLHPTTYSCSPSPPLRCYKEAFLHWSTMLPPHPKKKVIAIWSIKGQKSKKTRNRYLVKE